MMTACTSKHAGKESSDMKKENSLPVLTDISSIKNLVSIESPEGVAYQTGSVYIDSVKKVIHDDKSGLLIRGNLPSGCSKLLKINHTANADTLHLQLMSWKPKNKMCTQQLVPFTYLYYPDIPPGKLKNMQFCDVNGQTVPFDSNPQ